MSKALFRRTAFAGHSLGEYSALASIANVLHISALVDVVFYCGITMQRAVEHDSENCSNYAMCAINPSRVSSTFSDAALCEVVDSIATRTTSLPEIVNYNVEVSLFDHEVARFLINQSTRVNNMFVLESSLLCRLLSIKGFIQKDCVFPLASIPPSSQ